MVANNSLWTVGLPVSRDATTPGMTSNNSAQWLYPAVWTQVTGVSVSSEWDRVATDAVYPGSVSAVVHGGPGVGSVDLVTGVVLGVDVQSAVQCVGERGAGAGEVGGRGVAQWERREVGVRHARVVDWV